MEVAIIGGGASGFFAAITVKENYPHAMVTIFEKSQTSLAKVKISGGGRCNVTNNCSTIKELSAAYPRGGNFLKKAFKTFDNKSAMKWFEANDVPLVVQDDDCVFPESQDSQTIIDCFFKLTERHRIRIRTKTGVNAIQLKGERLELSFTDRKSGPEQFDKVIVSIGGCPQRKDLKWLERLDHTIVDPVPSLFTFNMPHESTSELMGIVVQNARVNIQGTKLKAEGPVLFTHWGMSGPAILKLSALGARILKERHYTFNLQANWVNEPNQDHVKDYLKVIMETHPKKILTSVKPFDLPERLWRYILKKNDLQMKKRWGELGKKGLNKMVTLLTNDTWAVKSKTKFREEFVTCGGISLKSVDPRTMGSKMCKNLYFTGEVLDIDGITGGFNFQAAWTTAFIAGKLM